MNIGWVAPRKPSHPYLENDPAPLFDLHYLLSAICYLRISPWLWFSTQSCLESKGSAAPRKREPTDVQAQERNPAGEFLDSGLEPE